MSTGGGEEHGSRMLLSSHSYSPVELQNERCREERRREEREGKKEPERRCYFISERKPSEPKELNLINDIDCASSAASMWLLRCKKISVL